MITHLQTYQTLQEITVSQLIEELPIKALKLQPLHIICVYIYAYFLWMTNLDKSVWGLTDWKIALLFFSSKTIRFVLHVVAVCAVDGQLFYEWWLMLECSKHPTSWGKAHRWTPGVNAIFKLWHVVEGAKWTLSNLLSLGMGGLLCQRTITLVTLSASNIR